MQKTSYRLLLVLLLLPGLSQANWWNPFKNATDEIADIHLEASLGHIQTLMDKLYKKNPKEAFKSGFSPTQVKGIIFDNLETLQGHPALNNTH